MSPQVLMALTMVQIESYEEKNLTPCGAFASLLGMSKPEMNLTLGARLRNHRRRCRLSQRQLAENSGISQKTISQIERGEVTARGRTIDALAEAINVAPMTLFGPGDGHDTAQPLQRQEVPLFGSIPAGPPFSPDAGQLEMFPVLQHLFAANRYCLRCEFDSMSPTIQSGDIILVEHRPGVEPGIVQGRVCVVIVNGDSTLKRLYMEKRRGNRRIVLRGDNPDAEPRVVDDKDEFSIQGVVIQIVSRQL